MSNTHGHMALLGVLAVSAAITASSAQACMFGLPLLSGLQNCPTGQPGEPSCPAQGGPSGRDDTCILSKKDVTNAAGSMGGMAAGGMEIAANVMRALSGQAMKFMPPPPEI